MRAGKDSLATLLAEGVMLLRHQETFVGRAQWKINQPPSLKNNARAWRDHLQPRSTGALRPTWVSFQKGKPSRFGWVNQIDDGRSMRAMETAPAASLDTGKEQEITRPMCSVKDGLRFP